MSLEELELEFPARVALVRRMRSMTFERLADLLVERHEARGRREWTRADEIAAELRAAGIEWCDTAKGPVVDPWCEWARCQRLWGRGE